MRLAIHSIFSAGMVSMALAAWVSAGSVTGQTEEELLRDARRAFDRIIELWRDEDFQALYRFGTPQSQKRLSREDFATRMEMAKTRLQCCWATVRGVKARLESADRAYITARIGYRFREPVALRPRRSLQPLEESFFEHETFYLVLEEGRWRVNLFRILEKSSK